MSINDPTSAAYEDLRNWLAGSFKQFLDSSPRSNTGTSCEIAADYAMIRMNALIEQAIAEAYEQGKNAGHAAQHAKDFDELAEAEAYQVKALVEAETRGRLDAQRTQVEFMAALLCEYGGKIEISSKSVLDANPKDTVEVYDDPSGKRIYRLYTKQANADGANGRDGEDK